MPVTWDDASDKKMLLKIIHIAGLEKLNWTAIAESMGEEYTLQSVQTRFKRLKQQARNQFGEPGGAGNATPKSKAKGDGEKTTGSKRKAKKAAVEEGEDDEEEVIKTPSKKMKVEEKAEESEGELV